MASPESSGDGKTSPFGDGMGGSKGMGRKPVDRITNPNDGGGGTGPSGKFDEMQTTPFRQKTVEKHEDHSEVDTIETDGGGTFGRLPFADTDPSVKDPKGAGSIGKDYKPYKLRG